MISARRAPRGRKGASVSGGKRRRRKKKRKRKRKGSPDPIRSMLERVSVATVSDNSARVVRVDPWWMLEEEKRRKKKNTRKRRGGRAASQ